MSFLKKLIRRHQKMHDLITGLGLIVFWRGIWEFLDIYLFPNYPTISCSVSILIGLLILYINDRKFKELT